VKTIPAAWPACLVAASTLAVLPCAPAQAGEEEPQRVEIVGSHLKRPEQEGPTPITIYRRDDIEARGATLLSEFLLSLPFAGAGSFDDRANIFSFHTGTAAISLRGLGPSATLVLLNGRRIAAYGLSLDDRRTFVDLNSIPMAAIDRIEVLRDGASAIYGADAIGGVVNIVLRGDFRGAEASVLAGRSTQGGAGKRYASVSIGTGDSASDGHNVLLIVDALKQDELRMSERAFSSSADLRPRGGVDTRSLFSVPPTVEIDGVPQPGIGCPPERVVPDPLIGGSYCVFDPNPYASLLPQTERIGALAAGSQAMAGSLRMYTELALNRTLTKHGIAPMPVVFLVPAAAPANPYGRDVGVYWRVLDLGQRRTESTVDFARAVAGIQGEWGTWQTWEWDLAVGAATVGTRFSKLNHASSRQVESLVASGALNPFAGGSAPETLSSVGIGGIDRYRGSSRHVLASARSELVQLTHGALAMALGVERRRESFSVVPDPKVIEGELAGALDGQEGAQRSIDAAFVEVAAPLGRHVEMQLAARHDRYSDFGSSTSPKIAVRWQPSRRLMLRASAGTGFLPPSLQQIHAPEGSLFIPNVDRIRCPVTHSPSDCGSRGILTLLGNSTDLKAETSRQHNIGIVVEPTPGVSVGFDAWHIRHRGKIDMAIGYVLENEALFPGRVVRAAPSAEDLALGLPGPIVEVHGGYINVALRDVRGVDLELKGDWALHNVGKLTLGGLFTYSERFIERATPQSDAEEMAGFWGRVRQRGQLSASLQRGPWHAGITANFIGGYRQIRFEDGSVREVASWTAFDIHAGWRGRRNELSLAIRNLVDREPPRVDAGYDASVHDPIGRYVTLSWRQSF
jgi:iron complex outermembrane receptor protein